MQRREFLAAGASLALASSLPFPSLLAQDAPSEPRKKIAFLGTEVRTHSHAQHFLDRLTTGYAWQGRWTAPRVDVASVYIDQFPEADLGRERIERHHLTAYPTIAEALTLGTGSLAVDGVVIIAEHGNYPRNEKGQTRYPRYDWFKECVKVFEQTGKSCPIFNDKHLSTVWSECAEMVADSKRLGFAFQAGSSLPVTWRLPSIDMPYNAPLVESVCVAYGGVDSYDFHALETAQCMSERRRGGEVGISKVHAVSGAKLWEMLDQDAYASTRELMVAALTRSHNLPVQGGFPTDRVTYEWARKALPDAIAYFIEHRDGFKTTIFLMAIQDFNYAGRLENGELVTCQMYLPMPTHGSTTADFFTPLVRHIETMILTGKSPYPVERTLLTSGMVIGGVESLFAGQVPYETPDMAVEYQVSEESTYWRV